MEEKKRTLCSILAEMRKEAKYDRRYPDDDIHNTLDQIQNLIEEAQEAGERLEKALTETTRLLGGNDFVKCPKCGWEEVDVDAQSCACAGCGLPVKRTSEWNPRWEMAEPIEGTKQEAK